MVGVPTPEWFDPRKPETVTGCWLSDLRPSEVVHETILEPDEQAPLVARSVTPPSPSGRGGTILPRQRAPRSCTVFVMTPPNEHTSEGGRDDRGVPYHAESTLSSAQVLKFFSPSTIYILFPYSFRILVPNRVYILEYAKNTAPNMPRIQLQIGPIFSNILYIPAENR